MKNKFKCLILFMVILWGWPGLVGAFQLKDLEGNWEGFLITNLKEVKNTGGHTAQGDHTTPIQMLLQRVHNGVAGFARVGPAKLESWVVTKNDFSWSNGKTLMHTKPISEKQLPEWTRAFLKIESSRQNDFLFFQYESCHLINSPSEPCVFGRDLADADLEKAVFVFEKKGTQLHFYALYTFDKEQKYKRVLKWWGERLVKTSEKQSKK